MSESSTVLVTGGAGYVGSLVSRELLAQGHRVVAADALLFGGEALLDLLSNPAFTFERSTSPTPRTSRRCSRTTSMPWSIWPRSSATRPARRSRSSRPDHLGRLAEPARRASGTACGHFVFASTCSNYGKMEGGAVLDEDAPLRPVSLYAELKVRVRSSSWPRSAALDFTILRFATVYGLSLRPRFDLTINEFARDALLKGELEIFGPEFWRPYCHVRDIANAVAMILEQDRERVAGRVFNVGADEENYQKRTIAEASPSRFPVTPQLPSSGPRTHGTIGSPSRRIAALGFVPRMRLPGRHPRGGRRQSRRA